MHGYVASSEETERRITRSLLHWYWEVIWGEKVVTEYTSNWRNSFKGRSRDSWISSWGSQFIFIDFPSLTHFLHLYRSQLCVSYKYYKSLVFFHQLQPLVSSREFKFKALALRIFFSISSQLPCGFDPQPVYNKTRELTWGKIGRLKSSYITPQIYHQFLAPLPGKSTRVLKKDLS